MEFVKLGGGFLLEEESKVGFGCGWVSYKIIFG